MADPRVAFKNNPFKSVKVDLMHEAAGPAYGSTGANHKVVDPEKEFAKAHYEQHMRVRGTMGSTGRYGDRRPRPARRFVGPALLAGRPPLSLAHDQLRARLRDDGLDRLARRGHRSQGGVVYRGDKFDLIVSVDIDTSFEDNGLFHKDLVAHLKLNTGEQLDVSGKVMGFIPLRNRREGMTTHVGEGMTEFRCGDAVGYGLTEYLDQVE